MIIENATSIFTSNKVRVCGKEKHTVEIIFTGSITALTVDLNGSIRPVEFIKIGISNFIGSGSVNVYYNCGNQ